MAVSTGVHSEYSQTSAAEEPHHGVVANMRSRLNKPCHLHCLKFLHGTRLAGRSSTYARSRSATTAISGMPFYPVMLLSIHDQPRIYPTLPELLFAVYQVACGSQLPSYPIQRSKCEAVQQRRLQCSALHAMYAAHAHLMLVAHSVFCPRLMTSIHPRNSRCIDAFAVALNQAFKEREKRWPISMLEMH